MEIWSVFILLLLLRWEFHTTTTITITIKNMQVYMRITGFLVFQVIA